MENYINTVSFEGDKPVSSLDQKTLSEVKSDSRFEERLEKYCWRQIDGKDHNRLSLYWNILSNSSNENIKIETSKNSIFLNDMKQIGCNTFDMKILMTTSIDYANMTSSMTSAMTSPLLPIMEPDISISNLVQIEKTLVQHKPGYVQFSLAADWLIKQLQSVNFHVENDMPNVGEVIKQMPNELAEKVVTGASELNFDRLDTKDLKRSISLFGRLGKISKSRKFQIQDQIKRKVQGTFSKLFSLSECLLFEHPHWLIEKANFESFLSSGNYCN